MQAIKGVLMVMAAAIMIGAVYFGSVVLGWLLAFLITFLILIGIVVCVIQEMIQGISSRHPTKKRE